ncbi:MAG: transketolase [Candidatus Thermoplasmatota archaeon]|nr:transketolase [Candidatus Thermoplasmatota archaeon]MBS3789889.1 transketolase [Candidatus Thermoplasmatota archaeon]
MPGLEESRVEELEEIARRVRVHIVKSTHEAGSGHPGGSLSATDILTALYFEIMDHRPEEPEWPKRDRLVLSKGHAAPALYGVLAESGYFPVEELMTLRKLGSRLQGHPHVKTTPGVDASTGSLGQGLSIASGMALAARLDRESYRVFAICGDGEIQSGQIWEAAMFASHNKLDNLIVFLDRNKLQIDGSTEEVMSIEPIISKWSSFGWHVLEINGHDMDQIVDAVDRAEEVHGEPTIIVSHTIKGKGVPFMEGSLAFHGKAANDEQLETALKALGENDGGDY